MERSTFSEDNSVPFRKRSSLPSNLILTVRAVKACAAGESGITSCLPTIQTQSATSRWLYAYRAFLVN
jgi:hypothetical protein